jgi:hypothetical protein
MNERFHCGILNLKLDVVEPLRLGVNYFSFFKIKN